MKPLENAIKISPFLLGNLRELNGRAVFFWQLGQSLKSLKFNFLLFLQDIPRCKRGVPAIARAPRVAGPGRGPVLGSRSPHCCAPQKVPNPGPAPHTRAALATPPPQGSTARPAGGVARRCLTAPVSMVGSPCRARPSPRAALALPRCVSMVRGGAVTWRGPGGSGGSGG